MTASGHFHDSAALRYPLNWRLGGRHTRSGRFEEAIIPLPLPRIEPISLVTIATTLKFNPYPANVEKMVSS